MQQTINGKSVFVVEFDTMPVTPITGLTDEETRNERMYDNILTAAIETGVITTPGKYGLYKDVENRRWEVYVINE